MQPSLWQILIVAALVLILFGRGRISEMMGDVGKGIKSFKKGINDEEDSPVVTPAASPRIDSKPAENTADKSTTSDKTAG